LSAGGTGGEGKSQYVASLGLRVEHETLQVQSGMPVSRQGHETSVVVVVVVVDEK